ncbi:MAG: cell wall metabolism sensor histidine kinase WalK [Bacteroidales bacterium]|nr:cell wall metabolism sensor histidine kinase WalK [Bacteroidales bacterium]
MTFKKYVSSNQIALIAAASVCLFSIGLALILQHVQWAYWLTIIAVVVLFVGSYLVFQFLLKKFVENRLKVIYKSIYSKKKTRDDFLKIHRELGLTGVEQEVQNWLLKREVDLEKMKELEAYRREFLGNISHELKTPVFNIQGYISTLLDGAINDSEVNRKYLERAEISLERMISIINDLDIISQFENNQVVPHYSKFNLENLIKEVFDDFEIKAKESGVQLSFRSKTKSEPIVYADSQQIKQVLSNLVENSIRYLDKDNNDPYTKITIYDMHEKILVEVSDNGIGVAESDLSRIFERFYRTDKARSREKGGSGLGLAIVRHIINAHHQNISVRSAVGEGTTFGFTLDKAN